MFNESPTLLSDQDRAKQLKVLIQKLRQLYDPTRWTDPETFELQFDKAYIHTYALQSDLNKAFVFTIRVGRKATPARRSARKKAPAKVGARAA